MNELTQKMAAMSIAFYLPPPPPPPPPRNLSV